MTNRRVDAIVPLALLDAVKALDKQGPKGVEEHRKLGASATVSAQIDRYRQLVKSGGDVDSAKVSQLFQLVCRRRDANLLLSSAGRGAAHEALLRVPRTVLLARRITSGKLRLSIGRKAAERLAQRTFGVLMAEDAESRLVVTLQTVSETNDPASSACEFYGVAVAEILRALTDFSGALVHDGCRARGEQACTWVAGHKTGR